MPYQASTWCCKKLLQRSFQVSENSASLKFRVRVCVLKRSLAEAGSLRMGRLKPLRIALEERCRRDNNQSWREGSTSWTSAQSMPPS